MRSTLFILLLALGASSRVVAQVDAESARDKVIIKYSPLPMFDNDNTIQFGVEIPFGQSGFSIQQDLGYGHSSFSVWYRESSDNVPDKSTYKSRTNLKYYFFERRRVRGYFGVEYLFKNVVYHENQWIGRDCAFRNCGYFENKEFKIGRFVNAGHSRIGWQFYLQSRMTIDLFVGLGLRDIRVRTITPGLSDARISSPNEFWSNSRPGSREFVPSLAAGIHFGFLLGKFED